MKIEITKSHVDELLIEAFLKMKSLVCSSFLWYGTALFANLRNAEGRL